MPELERSGAARNGLPVSRPYVYKGTGRDIYNGAVGYLSDVQRSPREIAARLHAEIAAKSPEHAALVAGYERRQGAEVMPDPAPGWEWYRELADESEEPPAVAAPPVLATAPEPARTPARVAYMVLDGDELAELAAERGRYQAAMAAVPEPRKPDPVPAPPPLTAASRCWRCGYLTTAAGHKVACDE